jgi:hypothetical protein
MTPAEAAALFDGPTLVIAMVSSVVSFALGIASQLITFYFLNRRDVRDLDRETKRLAFWKAMRELKADNSAETGLSQEQINALNQRFMEEVQMSVDVMMGWKRKAEHWASAAAWLATWLGFIVMFRALLPLPDVARQMARQSGLTPGTAEYNFIQIVSILGVWLGVGFALRLIVYRPTYEMVQGTALRLMREHQGNIFTLFKK